MGAVRGCAPVREAADRGAVEPVVPTEPNAGQSITLPSAPERASVQTPDEHLAQFRAMEITPAECARRACRSAWTDDKLQPAPAGEDEARLRYPKHFAGVPVTPAAGRAGTVRIGTFGGAAAKTTTDGLPIPRERQGAECWSEEDAAQSIAGCVGGRLAYIHQTGEWLAFGPRGWKLVHRTAVEEACTDFAQSNILTKNAAGEVTLAPRRSAGRKAVGRAVGQLLEPMVGTEFPDWDAAGNLIMMPDGGLLDVFTNTRRKGIPADRIRRRVPVAPASDDDYNRSVFRRVVESLIPNAAEREWLQRRLGAALVNAEGLDDLIWLFGPARRRQGHAARSVAASVW